MACRAEFTGQKEEKHTTPRGQEGDGMPHPQDRREKRTLHPQYSKKRDTTPIHTQDTGENQIHEREKPYNTHGTKLTRHPIYN